MQLKDSYMLTRTGLRAKFGMATLGETLGVDIGERSGWWEKWGTGEAVKAVRVCSVPNCR